MINNNININDEENDNKLLQLINDDDGSSATYVRS